MMQGDSTIESFRSYPCHSPASQLFQRSNQTSWITLDDLPLDVKMLKMRKSRQLQMQMRSSSDHSPQRASAMIDSWCHSTHIVRRLGCTSHLGLPSSAGLSNTSTSHRMPWVAGGRSLLGLNPPGCIGRYPLNSLDRFPLDCMWASLCWYYWSTFMPSLDCSTIFWWCTFSIFLIASDLRKGSKVWTTLYPALLRSSQHLSITLPFDLKPFADSDCYLLPVFFSRLDALCRV